MSTFEIAKKYQNITDWLFQGGLLTIRSHADGIYFTTNENLYQFNLSIFLPKHSFLTDVINEFILNCLASGFLEQWAKESNPRKRKPDEHLDLQQLNVEHFSGCFYLCSGGLLLSFFVFVVEIACHKWKQRRQSAATVRC